MRRAVLRALRSLHEFELREVDKRLARDDTDVLIRAARESGVCVCGRENRGTEQIDYTRGSDINLDTVAHIVGLCSRFDSMGAAHRSRRSVVLEAWEKAVTFSSATHVPP